MSYEEMSVEQREVERLRLRNVERTRKRRERTPSARTLECPYCREVCEYPAKGRPRQMCRKHECFLKHTKARRDVQRREARAETQPWWDSLTSEERARAVEWAKENPLPHGKRGVLRSIDWAYHNREVSVL